MAQSGYTPILIYASGTASNVPLAANLTSSASGAELALNYADGKLYFKNSSGVVTLLAGAGGAGVVAGSNTQIQFNNSGVFGASANLTWDGSKVTASAYQTGGNLTFTGTGNRITGDFTNATVASRVAFQTSTVNGNTTVNAIPNGTATSSQFITHNAADPGNSSRAGFNVGSTTALFFSDLTGTGTYLPMAFNTGGSERMRIDSSGNVGIGTSSPTQKLDVNGIGRMRFSSGTGAGHYLDTTGNTSRFFVGTDAVTEAWRVYDAIGGTNRIYLDSSGNVGIGTISPVYRLSVVGPNNTGIASFSGNNNGVIPGSDGDATLVIGGNYAAGSAEVDYFHNNSTYKGTIGGHRFLQRTGASTTRDLMWLTENQTTFYTAGTERMRINSSGQVGIGTSAPTGQLDVRTAAGVVAQSNLYTGSNAAVVKFNIGQVGAIDWDIGLNATAGNFYIGGLGGSMAEAYKIVRSGLSIDYQTWNTGGAERMRIDSSGNVNIGSAATTAAAGGRVFDIYNLENTNSSSYALTRLITYNVAGTTTVSADIFKNKAGSFVFNNNETNAAAATSFGIGGSERMRIDSSGNLLLGTSSGSARLVVNGGTSTSQIRWEVNNAAFTQEVSTNAAANAYVYKTNDALYHVWKLSSAEAMRLDSSGNVGIGTSSPSGKLEVSSSGQNIVVSRSTGSYAAYQRTAPTGQQTYDFYTINGVEVARITGDPTYLGFSTGLGTERMRIDSSGNVGIGTGSPSSYGKFAVIGSGTTASTFSVVATDNAGTSNFTVRDDGLVTANKPAGLGYGTGSGGTVTQATSKSTSVTLNKPTGQITTNAAALAGNTAVGFVVNNSLVTGNDTVLVTVSASGNYTATLQYVTAGSFRIVLTNATGGSLSDAVLINFSIIKGATA